MSNADTGFRVAVVGATGLVGEAMLECLSRRGFPMSEVVALASERSAGTDVEFGGRKLPVADLAGFDFEGVDFALFSAGGSVSREHAPRAAAAGAIVIDNTSCFRYDDDVPLVVPEVNPEALAQARLRNIIANPNCSTIQMVVALKPLHDRARIKRVVVSTYQSVSGAGKEGMDELWNQTKGIFVTDAPTPQKFTKQIAFNVIPHIDVFLDNRYTKEEMKMVWETRKILGDNDILVNPTAVRIPVFYGHSEAVHIETRDKISAAEVVRLLQQAPGIQVVDGVETGAYPTPVTESSGADPVFVGRIREDISHPRGIDLWVVADNIRKGAALNSVQIAEKLAKNYL